METQKKLLTLGAGMASAAAILGGGLFMVQGANASPASSNTSGAYSTSLAAAKPDGAAEQAAYIKALATKLGISETQLTDALKSVQLDQIAQAVKEGKLTQAQADAMTARINTGTAPMFGFGRPGHDGGRDEGRGGAKQVDEAALATFLGIDEPTLETAVHSGKSLATVASEHGKSRDDLKAFLSTQLTTSLKAAVTAGKLTQAQADAKLAEATAKLDARIDQVGGKGGPRHGDDDMAPPAANGSSSNGS